MKLKPLLLLMLAAIAPLAALRAAETLGTPASLTPKPLRFTVEKECLQLPKEGCKIHLKGAISPDFIAYLQQTEVKPVLVKSPSEADIVVAIDKKLRIKGGKAERRDEAYRLAVTSRQAKITASTEAGAFYGVQSLLQMTDYLTRPALCCTVEDSPRYEYRGLMFDVSRHFRSVAFMKKQMDAMALLKLNRMHIHLTDAAGWRLQIDRYPRLTEFAAWRPQRTWEAWNTGGQRYCEQTDPSAHGGFYTKADIRELLDYARLRHIVVVPEIEMPGHSEEVLAAYPQLSCSGKPYENADFCPGKEATFEFLQNVLAEVIELFPSEYIHIGGDEAGKAAWKTCPDCQRRMKDEGLKDVDELQSYLVQRVEKFINAKGRKLIGWDEILQGGLAPNAAVMSWRGTKGGMEALKAGHKVVMSPGDVYYLDHAQDAPFRENQSIGGYTPLEKVYAYMPEAEMTADETAHLLGVQGNLWTEHVTEDSFAEYMYYPRAFAIAETGWTRPEDKSFGDFRRRAEQLCTSMKSRNFETFDLANEYGERKEKQYPAAHMAKGCKVSYNIPYSPQYTGGGDTALTDGLYGGWALSDKQWQGTMKDIDVVVDLGEAKDVHYVGATFLQESNSWVYMPKRVEVFLSENGDDFTLAATVWNDIPETMTRSLYKLFGTSVGGKARFVRVHAVNDVKPGAWLFTDEIVIN